MASCGGQLPGYSDAAREAWQVMVPSPQLSRKGNRTATTCGRHRRLHTSAPCGPARPPVDVAGCAQAAVHEALGGHVRQRATGGVAVVVMGAVLR